MFKRKDWRLFNRLSSIVVVVIAIAISASVIVVVPLPVSVVVIIIVLLHDTGQSCEAIEVGSFEVGSFSL